jgi:hypothetical protein
MAIVLVSAAAFGGVASLRRRVQDARPPRPSLSTRRWIVLGVTLAAVALHLWSWLPLRPVVPPNASAGSVLSGGPGDGLWLMLVVLAPWLCMQPLNVCLACFCARSLKQAALIAGALVAVWIGTALLGGALTRCPAGFVCTGG